MTELKHLVRIANTDLDGRKQIAFALRKIKGVNVMYANMACSIAGIEGTAKAGALDDSQVEKLDDVIKNPTKYNAPPWMLNRRKDNETGRDIHLLGGELQFAKDNDIKIMKKIKCYRGIRHMLGLPVRGQRTRSNFRPNKGKVLGVKKSAKQRRGGKT